MKICYFGIYDPNLGRNKIYIKGLKENGVDIIECGDLSWGPLKFVKLFYKHFKIRKDYDYLIVGYPGHIIVWLAKLISKKPVVFDALCTMYEGVILSRGQFGVLGIRSLYIKFIDWLAVKCADIVLIETESQRKYFEIKFGKDKNREKYKVLYTGADDGVFYPDQNIKKREKFTVVFRGKFLPEAGVKYVIDAAKLLKDQNINFLIIGNGWLEKDIRLQIADYKLGNLELIIENLSEKELRNKMSECHVSLGQFENHERLERTIPHKCFESLAIGLPYLTSKTEPLSEILRDGENVIFTNQADPKDLAEKILMLKNNPEIAKKIGDTSRKIYAERFTPKVLACEIINIINK